eukprot:TRINITY_DN107739_c0_g1_i1.p1 TRINITY_DN107739_c0_g1~~TRINITY_DN107739_c0_g1_i1.p1  ORF type:complete len:669 (-),score=111.55 TRINITY_DN107739_c0_g1_i1:210-2216(-)
MDPRRRPLSAGGFGQGLGHLSSSGLGGCGARPSSAPRRRPTPAACGAGLGGLDFGVWGKDRKPEREPSSLSRQSSAPNLVPPGHGGFEPQVRGPPQGGGYDHLSRSPGMRRSASATNIGPRPCPPGGPGLRPGYSAAPRRRPYESGSPVYGTPDRRDSSASRAGGLSSFQKADAMQLETRLTERLREHSFASAEPTRRPAADARRRASSQSALVSGPSAAKYAPPSSYWDGNRSGSDLQYARGGSRGASPWHERGGRAPGIDSSHHQGTPGARPPLHSATPSPYQHSHYSSHYAGNRSGMDRSGLDEESMPETRLKIYSDLFEEVIERDRVFGSLLRKVKTAYDSMLTQASSVPPMPGASAHDISGHDMSSFSGQGRHFGGGGYHSSEPTMRAEDGGQPWELHRENQVLKDLVERLHLELEEAVKREQRWKHKAAKLKARGGSSAAPVPPPMPPPQGAPGYADSHGFAPGADGFPHPLACFPGQGSMVPKMEMLHEELGEVKMTTAPAHHASVHMSFHANRREPTLSELEVQGQEVTLNQGGLLSLSSISPQNSQNPPPEAMDGLGVSGTETARSTDSGMLPQRPTRRHIVKPASVPVLDFSLLKQNIDDEEEEDGDEDMEDMEDEERHHIEGHLGQLPMGSDSGYTPRDDESDEGGQKQRMKQPRSA